MRLTEHQAREVFRCQSDILYFAENYCWIQYPGLDFPIRFVPWNWQRMMLLLLAAGRNLWILKSRQIGFSWTANVWALWKINFNIGEGYYLSSKYRKAESLLRKAKYIYDRLPMWMAASSNKQGRSKYKLTVNHRYSDPASGAYRFQESFIESLTTTGTSAAGESALFILNDEVGLWKERGNDFQVWASVAPATTRGGQLVGGSTPRGYGGVFHTNWVNLITPMMNDAVVDEFTPYEEFNRAAIEHYAVQGQQDSMIPIKLHYSMCYHDEEWLERCCKGMSPSQQQIIREKFGGLVYDEAWRDRQMARLQLPMSMADQEFELGFERPGNAVFSGADLSKCYKPPKRYPVVAQVIQQSEEFFGGVDTAEGRSPKNQEPDYNSMVVLSDRGVQVAAMHNRDNLRDWAGTSITDPTTGKAVEEKGQVLTLTEKYTPMTLVVEKQGGGLTVINRIDPHLPDDVKMIRVGMSGPFKTQAIKDLALAIESQSIVITDFFTLECLRQFVTLGQGRFGASPGFYDDPVMALALAYYALSLKGYYDISLSVDMVAGERVVELSVGEHSPEDRAVGGGPMAMPDTPDGGMAGMPSIVPPVPGGLTARDLTTKRRRERDDRFKNWRD